MNKFIKMSAFLQHKFKTLSDMKDFTRFTRNASYLRPYLLVVLCSISLFFSCNKSEDEKDDPKSKYVGTWLEIETWTESGSNGNLVLITEPCAGDTEWTFNADGSFRYKDPTPCDIPFSIDLSGIWELNTEGTQLIVAFDFDKTERIHHKIDAFDNNQLTIHTILASDPNGIPEDKFVLKRK
jgi:hypothetical protein